MNVDVMSHIDSGHPRRGLVFIVNGLLTAMVTHKVQRARLHVRGPTCVKPLPEDLHVVTDPGQLRKTT